MPDTMLRICHLPSPMYGQGVNTPSPECPECHEVRVNLKGGSSACANGHGGLFTPVVEVGKWTPVKPEKILAARLANTLEIGSVANVPVGKLPKAAKHPKNVKLGKEVPQTGGR